MPNCKLLRIVAAMAMLTTTPIVDAQTLVCGPNGCTMVRSASRPVVRTVTRVAAAPVRVVRSGLFGRRVAYSSYAAPTASYGSSGGYSAYQATTQSYGSSGGYGATSYGSSGGTGSYGDGPTSTRSTAAPVTEAAPAATVPLGAKTQPSCPCGPDCQCEGCVCETAVCRVPKALPTAGLCRVPAVGVSSTCKVPPAGPSVGAIAGL